MIVSGDSLSGEKKFIDAFGFRNRTKLWFSANEIPEFDDKSALVIYSQSASNQYSCPLYFT